MRVHIHREEGAARFAAWLLRCGDGQEPFVDVTRPFEIAIPHDMCHVVDSKAALLSRVYPSLTDNCQRPGWLSERAILAALNESCRALNDELLEQFPGDAVTYNSIDKSHG